ncbi:N-acetylglucosamine-6-phosphate deacetylase [Alteromonadaceae bacterium BrNp21-10]|nr:N-acetylglucosamine-6-phosphate deacetylase [Alteromonadaceae bacterium BrNp21-10]
MTTTYFAEQLFDGYRLLDNQYFEVEGHTVVSVSGKPKGQPATTLNGLVVPGFIDVQVNGGGGALFNATPTLDCLKTMMAAHSQFGTTAMLPTLITDEIAVMQDVADTMAEAIASEALGILGVHYEGPHLSVPKRGIHAEHFVRPISDAELALFCRKDLGIVKVTLAPENVPVDVIADLVKQGVLVSLGHSNANAETVNNALAAGASCFTHLFNAMSPMTSREPGMVGSALADNASYCGLIVDHHHVHAQNCQLAIKVKTPQKIMLVTDAMAHVGCEQNTLPYFDTHITRVNDKLTVPGGTLAGSALDMASAVRNSHRDLNIALTDALTMATRTPAEFLGIDNKVGMLQQGYQADFAVLNNELQVQSTWIKGKQIY